MAFIPYNTNPLYKDTDNQMGLTPEQAVRQMLQNGGISQQQFQQYVAQADQIFGKRR